jgi:hypothetical protein
LDSYHVSTGEALGLNTDYGNGRGATSPNERRQGSKITSPIYKKGVGVGLVSEGQGFSHENDAL